MVVNTPNAFFLSSQLGQTLNQLLNNTFNNYDKRTRPFQGERPLIFSARITVAMLINLVSEAQTVSFNMAQYLRWQDPRLAWDPAKYNNISQIYVPSSSLWMPPIFFYNSIQTDAELSDPTALILSNGNITVYLPEFVNCVSRIVMDRFPFDTQYVIIGQTSALLPIQEMDAVMMEPPSLDQAYFLVKYIDRVAKKSKFLRFLDQIFGTTKD
uniref:Neurotransmitter-gated ion-channel ligand-binding domain-containing protein n=1 Tax=Acrobeloides nanus TaxID=290746 RepID=A0A914CLR2_9BILA